MSQGWTACLKVRRPGSADIWQKTKQLEQADMYFGFFTFINPFITHEFGRPTATVLKRFTWPVWTSQQSALLETNPFGRHCATVLCLPEGCLSWSQTCLFDDLSCLASCPAFHSFWCARVLCTRASLWMLIMTCHELRTLVWIVLCIRASLCTHPPSGQGRQCFAALFLTLNICLLSQLVSQNKTCSTSYL